MKLSNSTLHREPKSVHAALRCKDIMYRINFTQPKPALSTAYEISNSFDGISSESSLDYPEVKLEAHHEAHFQIRKSPEGPSSSAPREILGFVMAKTSRNATKTRRRFATGIWNDG